MDKSIGLNIARLRKEKKCTQEELAQYLGVTFQAVSKWENELAYPDITLLPAIADFFNTSIDNIMGYKNNHTEVPDWYSLIESNFSNIPKKKLYSEAYNITSIFIDALSTKGWSEELDHHFRGGLSIMTGIEKEGFFAATAGVSVFGSYSMMYKKPDLKDILELLNILQQLSNSDTLSILLVLLKLYWDSHPNTSISIDTIVDISGVNRNNVVIEIRNLHSAGLIEATIGPNSESNTYYRIFPDKAAPLLTLFMMTLMLAK